MAMLPAYSLTEPEGLKGWQVDLSYTIVVPQSLKGLREQVVSWLEGDTIVLPYYARRPYHETRTLIPALIALNNAGLFTFGSQPGEQEPSGRVKRAWVHGWCESAVLSKIRDAINRSGLVLLEGYRPPSHLHHRYPTNKIPGQDAYSTVGTHASDEAFLAVDDELAPIVIKHHQVTIIDPTWARNDRLWSTLTSALGCRTQKDDRNDQWRCNVCCSRFEKKEQAMEHGRVTCSPCDQRTEQQITGNEESWWSQLPWG